MCASERAGQCPPSALGIVEYPIGERGRLICGRMGEYSVSAFRCYYDCPSSAFRKRNG